MKRIKFSRGTSEALLTALVAALSLSACNEEQQNADGSLSTKLGHAALSVRAARIRPQADPGVVAQIKQEEQDRRLKEQQAMEEAARIQQAKIAAANAGLDPAQRNLPAVDQNPISGFAKALGFGGGDQKPADIQPVSSPPPERTASYPNSYQSSGSFIPPPPAVSLSGQMYTPPPPMPAAYPNYPPPNYGYPGGYNPYNDPNANPYAMAPPVPQASPTTHAAGSMFTNTSQAPTISASEDQPKPKQVVLITPTGMEPRSTYKQRDDLKLLLKAALANSRVKELKEGRTAETIARIDVVLPSEPSKGNNNITQRQIDSLFRTPQLDPKVYPVVKRIESDVAQAYFRYLAAYNRYTLGQQQVAARKQEVEVADSNAERQRAAADLSSAQTDAESSKEDLRSAQSDLASYAGPQAARSVITKVTGIAPSMDALASGDDNQPRQKDEGVLGSVASAINNITFFGHSPAKGAEKIASSTFDHIERKHNKRGKDDRTQIASADTGSSSPSPASDSAPAAEPKSSPPPSSTGINFELKNVQTTARKSILKVAIKNNSSDSLSIDPDNISVAEGDHKLAEAAVRSEFEQTLVAPNQEVTGTITIFGRPWSDRLSVTLQDGSKTVGLRR